MDHRTRNNPNPHRVPNVAKYKTVAGYAGTWARMVNSTNFNGPNGCWEWTKTLNAGGYGVYAHHEVGNLFAHRLALHVAGRPVPADMTVDHICMNRKCVNPAHLDIVPLAVNILRGNNAAAINLRKTHCPQGHEYTTENTYLQKPRTKTGHQGRQCRECLRIRSRAYRSKAAA